MAPDNPCETLLGYTDGPLPELSSLPEGIPFGVTSHVEAGNWLKGRFCMGFEPSVDGSLS